MAGYLHMRTFAMVSGNRSATRPPPTSTDEANRMGMALVMPTRDPKIRFPNAAESLHRALQNPKPVPLGKENNKNVSRGKKYLQPCCEVYLVLIKATTEAVQIVMPHLLTVGNDSVVTTSREFQAEMLRPL